MTTLIIGLLIPLLASMLIPVLLYMFAFAAGAMFYVVVEELIPEASSGQHSNLSTIGFAIGFVLILSHSSFFVVIRLMG
jgi:ZIP family zinc transporter